MNYIDDPEMPRILRDALIASNKDYAEEVGEYLKEQGSKVFNISATALSKPTQAMVLFSRHKNNIWIDPEKDCWHSMRGSIIHFILESQAAKNPRYISEMRLGVDLEIDGEIVHIHGKMDI